MNLSETLRGLARRWYIVVPGVILAVVLAFTAWTTVKPDYERTATEMLLPGTGTLPEGATNPYLYLGGLTAPADVLVRAVGSDEVLSDLLTANPGSQIEVTRDPSAAGPVILIKVTADSDSAAASLIQSVVDRTSLALSELQDEESIRVTDRITVRPISVDEKSTLQQRNRIVTTAGVALGVVLMSIVLASFVDGLATRARRPRQTADDGEHPSTPLKPATDSDVSADPSPAGDSVFDTIAMPLIEVPSAPGKPRASVRAAAPHSD